MEQYFGTYQTFDACSKEAAATLLGADCLVGDVFDVKIELREGEHYATMVSRFGQEVAVFNPNFSRKLSIALASDMEIKAVLSFVAFTEGEEKGHYWGEAAVFAYSKVNAAYFEKYVAGVALKIQENVRPRIDFGREGVDKIIDSEGNWVPDQSIPMPEKKKGTVIMKDHRTLGEKMIEEGRNGNKGCLVVSWLFIAAIAVGVLAIIAKLFL